MLHERDPERRAPLHTRMRVKLLDNRAIIHLLLLFAYLAAFMFSTAHVISRHRGKAMSWTTLMVDLFTYVLWPPFFNCSFLVSLTTPLTYTLWPPNEPLQSSRHKTYKAKEVLGD